MAQIANRTGHAAEAANYSSIAHHYIDEWQTLGFSSHANPPHAKLSYGNDTFDTDSTWGLLYNLFADKELGLRLVPQRVYDIQNEFYPTVFAEFGVVRRSLSLFSSLRARASRPISLTFPQPLDTRHTYTKSKISSDPPATASLIHPNTANGPPSS